MSLDPRLELLSSYSFDLPDELIARVPVEPRDHSRLLVLDRKTGRIEHRRFFEIGEYLNAEDVLVANDTRVMRARLRGNRVLPDGSPGGKIEFLLLEQKGLRDGKPVWEGLFRSTAAQRVGLKFKIPTPDGQEILGELVRGSQDSPEGTVEALLDRDPLPLGVGELPLPPYFGRNPVESDTQRYQTVYSAEDKLGSAAAPTAGLHFTPQLLRELTERRGVGWEQVTLHVGLGTFRPVKVADIRKHPMHEERYWVSDPVAKRLDQARATGKTIVAVGTTSVRTLESACGAAGGIRSGEGRTRIFFYPGARPFQVVDRLITNFHLPESTLLMLVCAFAGRELVLEAYRKAIEEKYRFYSYGDAMLIL